jgi:hypothetical protein
MVNLNEEHKKYWHHVNKQEVLLKEPDREPIPNLSFKSLLPALIDDFGQRALTL